MIMDVYQVSKLIRYGIIVALVCCVQKGLIVSAARVECRRDKCIELVLRQTPVLHLLPDPPGSLVCPSLELCLGLICIDGPAQLLGRARSQMSQQTCPVSAIGGVVVVIASARNLAFTQSEGNQPS